MRRDSALAQTRGEQLFVLVATGKTNHLCVCAQAREVHGHVGRTARLLALVGSANHRHRRLRGDAPHVAPDVFVEHHVAHHQQALGGPFVLDLLDHLAQLLDHLGASDWTAATGDCAAATGAGAAVWVPAGCAPIQSSSIQSQSMWPARMWASWMRAVSREATAKR